MTFCNNKTEAKRSKNQNVAKVFLFKLNYINILFACAKAAICTIMYLLVICEYICN